MQEEKFVAPVGMEANDDFVSVAAEFPTHFKGQVVTVQFDERGRGKYTDPNITLYVRTYDPVYEKDQPIFLRLDSPNQSFDPKAEFPVNAQTYTGVFFKYLREKCGWPPEGFQKRKVVDVANQLKGMFVECKKFKGNMIAPKVQTDKYLIVGISATKIP